MCGLSCLVAYWILVLDQGLNPRLLHWKVDSLPLDHQGSPLLCSFFAAPPQLLNAIISLPRSLL